jgi:hypothetical protein
MSSFSNLFDNCISLFFFIIIKSEASNFTKKRDLFSSQFYEFKESNLVIAFLMAELLGDTGHHMARDRDHMPVSPLVFLSLSLPSPSYKATNSQLHRIQSDDLN